MLDDLIINNVKIIDGKITIPEKINQIKFDVGLAGEAPNSAIWLTENNDRYVIGIEPLQYHWDMINNFETSNSLRQYPNNFKILQLEEGVVKLNKNIVTKIDDRFCGIKCAIDNNETVKKRKFYQVNRKDGASGASSLLKPNNNHPQGNDIEDIIEVDTISLSYVLDHIPWDRFEFIEHIKTDCEGYDYEVVKSIGDYLNKVVFISSELLRKDYWDNKSSDNDFVKFMVDNDFKVLNENGGEINFVNNKLVNMIDKYNLNNKTLGL